MSDSGRKLKRYTPRPATLESVENAITDTPRVRASCAVAGTASAISAAFFIDCAATPALPAPDSGRIKPTLNCPVPTATPSCGGPAGPSDELNGLENWLRDCCTLEQAPSRGAPRMRPIAVLRVAAGGGILGLCGPFILSLLLADRNRPGLHAPAEQGAWI